VLARSKLSFQGCQGIKHGEWVIVSKSEVIVLNKVWETTRMNTKVVEAIAAMESWEFNLKDQLSLKFNRMPP
jgi:hypothetical protein